MRPAPKVSVVIPAYNTAETLEQTLASVSLQTFADFEVLVVDDGSTDDTARVAESFPDSRVQVIRVRHGGAGSARNHGLGRARGDYIALLDADDVWHPDKLRRQVALLDARPAIGMCYTGEKRVDSHMRLIARTAAREYADYCEALLLWGVVIHPPSAVMVRTALARAVGGFDDSLTLVEDWDFWLRLSTITAFAAIADPLVTYRAGHARDVRVLERDTFRVLTKFFASDSSRPYLPIRARAYSNQWMLCAGSYLHQGQLGDAIRCLARGLMADPTNLRRPLGLPGRWLARFAERARTQRLAPMPMVGPERGENA